MNECIAQNPSQQAFQRDRAQPAHVSGQKRQQRGDKHQQPDSAQGLRDRRNHFARSEPAYSHS